MSEKRLFLALSRVKQFSYQDGVWSILYEIPDPAPTEAEAESHMKRKIRSLEATNEGLKDCIRELIRINTEDGFCNQCSANKHCYVSRPYSPCPIDAAWAKARGLVG